MSSRHQRAASRRRLRVVTYNILLGAARREDLVMRVLSRTGADVIALQEASNRALVERIAERLHMSLHWGEPSTDSALNLALLTRLPVRHAQNHRHPGRMLRSHLEVEVESVVGGGDTVGIHCVHLAARFGERANGEARRIREINAVLSDIGRRRHVPHIITGDFNALAPGDPVAATAFLRRMAELRRAKLVVRQADGLMGPRVSDGLDEEVEAAWLRAGIDPRLDVGIPQLPPVVGPLTALIPRSARLDELMTRRLERWSVERLLGAGYTDCYRRMHPRARGYTCATWLPAARIDYVFASPDLAGHLGGCEIVGSRAWPDHDVGVASDHFPVVADFAV
jgi:endonuclease/exonuclease/phosphatase family metal-dependent hydrolase